MFIYHVILLFSSKKKAPRTSLRAKCFYIVNWSYFISSYLHSETRFEILNKTKYSPIGATIITTKVNITDVKSLSAFAIIATLSNICKIP